MIYPVTQSSSYRLLTELVPAARAINETGLNKETGWLSIHNRGSRCQELSASWLVEVLNSNYQVDIQTYNGKTLYACHPNDARVVLTYSAGHMPPANGIVAWRISPSHHK